MDFETRRQKQQALMVKMVERKVRSRAKELYKTRGEVEGHALQDWVQAESEVLGSTVVAPLYRRLRSERFCGQLDRCDTTERFCTGGFEWR